jgi:hypothetical protein
MAVSTWRPSSFESASAQVIGNPGGMQTRCSRRPQKNRERDGQ